MPTLRFADRDVTLRVGEGETILDAALAHGVSLYHTCGGNASCSTCRVRVLEGADRLSPIESAEAQVLDAFDLKPPHRLACQSEIHGDVTVEIPGRERAPRANKTPPVPR
jgi:2Fe-2S ferredoxin